MFNLIAARTASFIALKGFFISVCSISFAGFADWLADATTGGLSPHSKKEKAALKNQLDMLALSYTDIYKGKPADHLQFCVLGKNWWHIYERLVAGGALVIQGNGKALELPSPNVYRTWDT